MAEPEAFFQKGRRLTALELARSGNNDAWNEWRQQTNIFGDYQKNRVNLALANLSGKVFSGFNLTNVTFYRADLSGSDLTSVDCAYADFHEAKLIGAVAASANLRFARLSRAYLRNAVLDHADLRGADLRRASLTGTSLVGTDLRGVDLSNTRGLDQEQLDDAIGDGRTKLPSHLVAPNTWDVYGLARSEDDEGIENLRAIPASVEVAVFAGIVRLSQEPGDAHFASTADPTVLRREILEDIARVASRCNNIPELARAIGAYAAELSKENFDVILVGVRGLKVQSIFRAVSQPPGGEPDLLPDAIGAMHAILVQHFLFVNQSHRWKAFLEEAALAPYTEADQNTALMSGRGIAKELLQHPEACDSRVAKAIDNVTDEIEIGDDSQRLAVFNVFASVENLYKGIITWIVREAKRFLGDAWENFRSNLSRIAGVGLASLTTALLLHPIAVELATLYPERFAWLIHAMELIKAIGP